MHIYIEQGRGDLPLIPNFDPTGAGAYSPEFCAFPRTRRAPTHQSSRSFGQGLRSSLILIAVPVKLAVAFVYTSG